MKFKKVQIERRIHKETSFDSDVAETGNRGRARGTGDRKMGTKQRIGNGVTEGLGFNLGFVPISHSPVPLACFPFT